MTIKLIFKLRDADRGAGGRHKTTLHHLRVLTKKQLNKLKCRHFNTRMASESAGPPPGARFVVCKCCVESSPERWCARQEVPMYAKTHRQWWPIYKDPSRGWCANPQIKTDTPCKTRFLLACGSFSPRKTWEALKGFASKTRLRVWGNNAPIQHTFSNLPKINQSVHSSVMGSQVCRKVNKEGTQMKYCKNLSGWNWGVSAARQLEPQMLIRKVLSKTLIMKDIE